MPLRHGVCSVGSPFGLGVLARSINRRQLRRRGLRLTPVTISGQIVPAPPVTTSTRTAVDGRVYLDPEDGENRPRRRPAASGSSNSMWCASSPVGTCVDPPIRIIGLGLGQPPKNFEADRSGSTTNR